VRGAAVVQPALETLASEDIECGGKLRARRKVTRILRIHLSCWIVRYLHLLRAPPHQSGSRLPLSRNCCRTTQDHRQRHWSTASAAHTCKNWDAPRNRI